MRVIRLSTASLASALESATSESLTYTEHGATLEDGTLPAGYRHQSYEIGLGAGRSNFERAVQGLRAWRAHRLPAISVYPSDAAVEAGTTVLVCLGRWLALAAPCRIVRVMDEGDRGWGFAYGTLPGHPEQGEEAFVIRTGSDGSVRFTITAFSRPADRLVRAAGPISRALQHKATEEYLQALRAFVVGRAT